MFVDTIVKRTSLIFIFSVIIAEMGKNSKKNFKVYKSNGDSNVKQGHNNNNHSSGGNSGILFNSGNPIAFAIARSKIINAFIAEDCYDYVNYDANNNIAEEEFADPEPDRNVMVNTQLANNIALINAHYNNIDANALTASVQMSNQACKSLVLNN